MGKKNLLRHGYVVPQCDVLRMDCEELLCGSEQRGMAVHEGFVEEDYTDIWN